jgi:hypothetical protein
LQIAIYQEMNGEGLSDQSQSSNMNAPVRISRLAEALEKEYD